MFPLVTIAVARILKEALNGVVDFPDVMERCSKKN
jgi:hypothetical protein